MDLLRIDEENYGFTIYWRIESFESEPSFDEEIKSQIFKIHSMNSNWQIGIMIENNYLSAYLYKITNAAHFPVHYSLSLLTGSGWRTIFKNEKDRFKAGGDGFGEDIVDLEGLKKNEWFYLPNGSLTISYQIWNDRIKSDSSQRLMISRLIDGDYLRHRPIQTFSNLKPSDLFAFPLSYEFPSSSPSTSNEKASTSNDQASTSNNKASTSNDKASTSNDKTSTSNIPKLKEVKTQNTQTDINFQNFNLKGYKELIRLFKEKDFSFVTLRTPTKEFSVHKAFLCAQSPVFKAMFEKEVKENDTQKGNKEFSEQKAALCAKSPVFKAMFDKQIEGNDSHAVNIFDIDNQTMDLFVKYLQFDPLDDLKWDTAISLYYAADKYQIDSLKEQCVSLLKKELLVENICDVLIMAEFHQNSDLMNYAQEFFCKHSKDILPSTRWKDILGHTELVAKLLSKLAECINI